MRWMTLLFVSAGMMFLVFAGVATAFTKGCDRGTDRADRMVGTAGRDALCGEGGDDRISGEDGNDTLVGGSENDRIDAGDGDDKIKGGTDRDMIHAGPGDDVVRGGMFNRADDGARDVLDCGDGTDTVYYTGADTVRDNCEISNPRR